MAASNAADIAAGTVSRSIMFAWQLHVAPVASPAWAMQSGPVATATPPRASTIADLAHRRAAGRRRAAPSSASRARTSPPSSRSSAFGPCAGSTTDCVATAPTPGRAQVQSEPTLNQCDWTAAPSSPVSGSRATIE